MFSYKICVRGVASVGRECPVAFVRGALTGELCPSVTGCKRSYSTDKSTSTKL